MSQEPTLYIYNGSEDRHLPDAGQDDPFTYCLGLGMVLGNGVVNLNDQDALNSIATGLREEYCEFIYGLNQQFLDAGAVYRDSLSLYFLSDLACKRTEMFSTYSDVCNLLLLRQLAEKHGIQRIVLDGCSGRFLSLCQEAFSGLELKQVRLHDSGGRSLLSVAARNFLYFGKLLVAQLMALVLPAPAKRETDGSTFLTRYPLHLDENLHEDKYVDLVTAKDNYLVHLLTDDLHQKLSIRQYLRYRRRLAKNSRVVVLDAYLGVTDILAGFFRGLSIFIALLRLRNRSFRFQGLELGPHIEQELLLSMMRIPRLLTWEQAFVRSVRHNGISRLVYYLHEYPYGRFITYVSRIRKLPLQLVGFQHGPASRRKLLYYCAKGELSGDDMMLKHFPQPDSVLAEEPFSAAIYRDAGYLDVQEMEKIHRLHYLADIQRGTGNGSFELIAPGLHDGRFMMRSLQDLIQANPGTVYVLKPHPRANNDYLDDYRQLENLRIEQGDIASLLQQATRVYATYSSVGIEARMLGIETRIIEVPGRVNESPLLDVEFLACLDSVKY